MALMLRCDSPSLKSRLRALCDAQAVAVMRKGDCENLASNLGSNAHPFSGLRGKKSCHTGYRKTAGWVLPV